MKGLDRDTLMRILSRAVGGSDASAACDAFQAPPSVSVRLNPSKVEAPEAFVEGRFGPGFERVPWHPFGFYLPERPVFTLDPLFHAGCYYVQDASAMAVGSCFSELLPALVEDVGGEASVLGLDGYGDEALPERKGRAAAGRPLRVLDLCAAPGGKTTDLVSSLRLALGDNFILVANEVMKSRAGVLADNVAIWGDPNVVVTSVDPKAFAALEGFFDLILTDVPCSGEGMFRKDEKAVEDWSPDAVKLCSQRQKRILADVWPSLRAGGRLLYSTCTFEEEENDSNVEWVAGELGADVLQLEGLSFPGVVRTRTGRLLVPGLVRGEGQFVAALAKTSPSGSTRIPSKPRGSERSKGGLLLHIPDAIRAEVDALERLSPIQAGVLVGERKGRDLVPSADLALSIFMNDCGRDFPRIGLDRLEALRFLRRDAVSLGPAPLGFVLVCHEGHPLGFVKNLGSRCNNLHPAGRRIRMEVR